MTTQTVTTDSAKAAAVAPVPAVTVEPTAESTVEGGGASQSRQAMRAIGGSAGDAPEVIASALEQTEGSPLVRTGLMRSLQRSYGNQYVGRVIQAKLAVGAVGDSYEQEADRVAETVMRMAEPGRADGAVGMGLGQRIQRMCLECEDELQMQPKKEKEEERKRLQKKDSDSGGGGGGGERSLSPAAERSIEQVRGTGGEPLPAGVRGYFESRFGEDFSGVRVHADGEAGESAQQIGALAYTVGRDMVFGTGQYQPESREGQKLIAHELTHVVQQGGSNSRAQRSLVKQRASKPTVHGAWTHTSAWDRFGYSYNSTDNGSTMPLFLPTGVSGRATAWQTPEPPEPAWCITGGTASLFMRKSTQYTFQHDGLDNDFLELTISGDIFGNAKAEDLHYAKSGALVAALIKVRTPANPTPPSTELFRIDDGGKSSAVVSTVADIDVTVPIDGTIKVKIPLKAVSEGELSPYAESVVPPFSRDVAGSTGAETIVDLYLGAYMEAAADIETNCWADLGGDVNWGMARAEYSVVWRNRAAPRVIAPPPTYGPQQGTCPESPAYRSGAKTGKNLTPRPGRDVPSGLSLTTTAVKKVRFPDGKSHLEALGFELQDDPTADDPCHFLLRPGPGHIARGWTLAAWAATRDSLDETNRSTWHELTKILYDAAETW